MSAATSSHDDDTTSKLAEAKNRWGDRTGGRHNDYEMMKTRGHVFEAPVAAYWEDFGQTAGHGIVQDMIRPIYRWILEDIRHGRLWTRQLYPQALVILWNRTCWFLFPQVSYEHSPSLPQHSPVVLYVMHTVYIHDGSGRASSQKT